MPIFREIPFFMPQNNTWTTVKGLKTMKNDMRLDLSLIFYVFGSYFRMLAVLLVSDFCLALSCVWGTEAVFSSCKNLMSNDCMHCSCGWGAHGKKTCTITVVVEHAMINLCCDWGWGAWRKSPRVLYINAVVLMPYTHKKMWTFSRGVRGGGGGWGGNAQLSFFPFQLRSNTQES